MPGMDGVSLLNAVKTQYPRIARIALSGQTSKETILKSVGPTHQFLSKPCDAQTLETTITRVCSFQSLLANEKLEALISGLESLPSFSSLYADLMEELQSKDVSMEKVGNIISRDVAMTTKILQLVNSAFFGVTQPVLSVHRAVIFLGLETIKALVLSIKIFSQFAPNNPEDFSLGRLLDHSFTVGEWAKFIAQAENADQKIIDYATLAGMLHDVGKLILASKIPDEYETSLSLSAREGISIFEAEREVFGATHAEVGAYLLGLWGFDNCIVEALVFHHNPAKVPAKEFTVLTAVHVADILENETRSNNDSHETILQVNKDYLNDLGLSGRLSVWREACLEHIKVKC